MEITTGTRLGPYEIVARIGSGGMGEVFRARDTRLDRSVAIKVLPVQFAQNAQLRLRFEREAKTISQLNHPNICTLYDVGDDYLVMELLEGESLADRVAKGPLPLTDVLRFGAQIADALDRAHRAGIVHRDLKPGNVMLTRSGAKLLDFGLAKGGAIDVNIEGATQQKSLTQEGTILGTFQYMAPEQLEGLEADARTDIFALGAVLYEMATGRRAFDGKTKTSLIAAIVSAEPKPMSELQPLTPPALEHVVRKCLSKEAEDRWQSAHDIAEELRWISEAGSQVGAGAVRRRTRTKAWTIAAAVAAVACITAAVAAVMWFGRAPRDARLALSLTIPAHAPYEYMGWTTLSPGGERVVFVGYGPKEPQLWIRSVDSLEAHPLAGTEGASQPFWSPDGSAIAFFAGGKLKRVAAAGGPSQLICDATVPSGGTWGADGTILFEQTAFAPLMRVPASGGTPVTVTRLTPKEEGHRWPVFLPDGDHFLFMGDAVRTEDHHLKIGSLRTGEVRDLIQAISEPAYAEPFVLYVRGGSLLAQRLDLGHLALAGEPRLLAEHIVGNWNNHHHDFSVASNGRLTYRAAGPDARLAWVDRAGKVQQVLGAPRRMGAFRLSPSQRTAAIEQLDADGRGDDVWLFDIARDVTTRFTTDPATDMAPVWSPDGGSIAFLSMRSNMGDVYIGQANNPGTARLAFPSKNGAGPSSWSPDGSFLLLRADKPADVDVFLYSVRTGEGKPYIATPFAEYDAMFSPDGKFVAYVSEESGQQEVYVERFPTHADRRQVSTARGGSPKWRGDSKELFYVRPGGMLMSVDMRGELASPKELFVLRGNCYEPAADGQRFLVDEPVDDVARVPLTFLSGFLK